MAIQTTRTAPNEMRNFQLPPNSAMWSESRSPKVSSLSNCLVMSFERISCCCKLSITSWSSAESSPISSCNTSFTYSFRNFPRSSKQIKPLPSQPGMRVEHEYERGGALAYPAAWDVRRGGALGRCDTTTGSAPFGQLVDQVMAQEPYRSAPRD